MKGGLGASSPIVFTYHEIADKPNMNPRRLHQLRLRPTSSRGLAAAPPSMRVDGRANEIQDGILAVSLRGSCSGCPSSMITLKSGIENLMRQMVPGVREVVAEEL